MYVYELFRTVCDREYQSEPQVLDKDAADSAYIPYGPSQTPVLIDTPNSKKHDPSDLATAAGCVT